MARFIRRITVVALDDAHHGQSTTVYKKKKKKRKVSKFLRPFERGQRRMLRANEVFGGTLLRRHKRSNRKRRNGFLRDMGINNMKASRKAFKKLRLF